MNRALVGMAASLLAACGGGASSDKTSPDVPPDPIEASALESDAAAVGDRDVTPDNVPDAASSSRDAGAGDAHVGPWLPLVDPSLSDALAPGQACESTFRELAAANGTVSPACALFSPLAQTKGGGENLCALASDYASQYCLGVNDTKARNCVNNNCPDYGGFPPADIALCIFRCYDAAICGEASAAALAKCDGTSDPVCGTALAGPLDAGDCSGVTKDPLGCLIRESCYPSFDPNPW